MYCYVIKFVVSCRPISLTTIRMIEILSSISFANRSNLHTQVAPLFFFVKPRETKTENLQSGSSLPAIFILSLFNQLLFGFSQRGKISSHLSKFHFATIFLVGKGYNCLRIMKPKILQQALCLILNYFLFPADLLFYHLNSQSGSSTIGGPCRQAEMSCHNTPTTFESLLPSKGVTLPGVFPTSKPVGWLALVQIPIKKRCTQVGKLS